MMLKIRILYILCMQRTEADCEGKIEEEALCGAILSLRCKIGGAG